MTARSDHSDLTTWTDEFCDRRDLGTIYSLITEEELCARRYWKRQVPKRRWGCRNQLGRIPSSETLFRTPLEPTIAVFTALSSSCHCLAPAPVPACRRRAACLPPSRNHEALPPAGPATHCFPLPSPPASIIPVRLPRARTSRTGDRAGDDRHTSTPERAPAVRDRPAHAQSVGSEPEPARSARNACSSVPVDTACASLRIAGWRAIKSRGVWDRARSRPQVSLSELGNGKAGTSHGQHCSCGGGRCKGWI